jgi:hypothetical protein
MRNQWLIVLNAFGADRRRKSEPVFRTITPCVRILTPGIVAAAITLSSLFAAESRGDVFEYVDEDGKTQTVEGRLHASGEGIFAVEPADGSLRLIPQDAVKKRTPGPDPKPIAPQQMLDQLRDEFGTDKFRGVISNQYVIGVVLQAPLPRTSERRVSAALRKSARYMQSIQSTFASFVRKMNVVAEKAKFPMVVLIFETDDDFEAYTAKATGNRGLSAGNIAGFYSHLTNYLYVRMSECYTFGTPLHEAIHQQCFNTGVFQRLAPIPVWFAEGMASGFEGGGDKVRTSPQKLNFEYARLITEGVLPRGLGWDVIAGSDQIFRGDIFAGPAYIHGWSMHWFLVSNYRKEYAKYLQYIQTLPPLEEVSDRGRQAKFQELFGKTPGEFHQEFPAAFERALKRQKLPAQPDPIPGLVQQNTNLASIDLFAESNGRQMLVQGKLRNISPIREMSYYVTIVTDTGTFADWFVPRLKINQLFALKPQAARRPDGRFSAPGRSFRMRVQSVPADSDEAKAWASGRLPSVSTRRGN